MYVMLIMSLLYDPHPQVRTTRLDSWGLAEYEACGWVPSSATPPGHTWTPLPQHAGAETSGGGDNR